mmetsp:Transcript_69589/g.163590  ORF Transcript_69589/g.163590 Transcript_69589/m.163590 type:complete len:234 (+) Transcript_69589:1052-1753(+)
MRVMPDAVAGRGPAALEEGQEHGQRAALDNDALRRIVRAAIRRSRHVRQPTRQQIPRLVRPVLRADERSRQALHGQRGLRPAPVAGGHHRQPGPRRDAGRAGHPQRRRPCRHPARPGRDRRRDRGWPVRLEAGPGGRSPQHRGSPDRARGHRRQAPAHRPQPQRPGGHRRAALAARRDRRDPRPADGASARAGGPGRAARRGHPARLHPPAGGTAGQLRPPPAGVCGDVRAGC